MGDRQPQREWRLARGRSLPLDGGPLVMGVINVTPDSFSDGGLFADTDSAVAHGLMLRRAGADLLDVGGESARPGSRPVPPDEQLARILPVVRQLADQTDAAISVDTRSAAVARAALDAGAHLVNDISALREDPQMAPLLANRGAGIVLMHMQGTPADMQEHPEYGDVVAEVRDFLAERVRFATAAGIRPDCVAVDPGIGFGKTLEHNLALLANVAELAKVGRPVLVGPSRKRFIGEVLNVPVNERLAGSLSACLVALAGGAKIFRVHDPGPVRQALALADAILKRRTPAQPGQTAP